MNFFLKHKTLLPNIMGGVIVTNLGILVSFLLVSLIQLMISEVPASGKTFSVSIPAIIIKISFWLFAAAALLELGLNVFYSDYRKIKLNNPKYLGIKKVADERADYIIGEAARRSLSFIKLVGPLAMLITFPIAWSIVLGEIDYKGLGVVVDSSNLKGDLSMNSLNYWTVQLKYYFFITAPAWLMYLGSQIVFRRTLKKFKFDSDK